MDNYDAVMPMILEIIGILRLEQLISAMSLRTVSSRTICGGFGFKEVSGQLEAGYNVSLHAESCRYYAR